MIKALLLTIAAGVIVAIALIVIRRPKRSEKTFEETITYLRAEAVSIAKESYGVTLDFTPESVKHVEEILGKLHDEYAQTNTTKGQRGFALAFGVYIGEVIKKEAGEGHWERDHPRRGHALLLGRRCDVPRRVVPKASGKWQRRQRLA